jgi:tRNA A37 N6-isopentenylltransferase MiaA
MAGGASDEVATPFAFAVYGVDRGKRRPAGGSRRRWTPQIRRGLAEEAAELDRRYRLVELARRPGRRRNVASQTHGYREFVRVAASTGKAIAELDGADLAAARAEALGRIWAYSRRQQSWFRKLWRVADRPSVSGENHRVASAVIAPELEIALAQDRTTIYHADGK